MKPLYFTPYFTPYPFTPFLHFILPPDLFLFVVPYSILHKELIKPTDKLKKFQDWVEKPHKRVENANNRLPFVGIFKSVL